MNKTQVYRIEIRADFEGTQEEAIEEGNRLADLVDGELTAVFNEDFEEVL